MNAYGVLLLVFASNFSCGEVEGKLLSGDETRADLEERGGNIHLTFKIKI